METKILYFSAVILCMVQHYIDFTLLPIDINDTYVNKQVPETDVTNTMDYSWQFNYDFDFADYTEDHEKVTMHF